MLSTQQLIQVPEELQKRINEIRKLFVALNYTPGHNKREGIDEQNVFSHDVCLRGRLVHTLLQIPPAETDHVGCLECNVEVPSVFSGLTGVHGNHNIGIIFIPFVR